jgi:hypothetical protein
MGQMLHITKEASVQKDTDRNTDFDFKRKLKDEQHREHHDGNAEKELTKTGEMTTTLDESTHNAL